MSLKDNFTPDEWFKILNGPGRAGLVVIAASPSGLTGLLAEAGAIAQVVQDMIAQQPKTPLLEALADAYQHTSPEEQRALQQQAGEPRARPGNIQATKEDALASLRQVAWLLATKTTPEDALAYKALLIKVAERVAGAAKEGGFLGIGGVQVSDTEKAAIEEVKRVLGM